MSHTAPQRQSKAVSAVRNIAVSFSGHLDDGELLTGTPTISDTASPSPEVLTFSNPVVSTAALTINGISVPAGEAVQFSVSGGVADGEYTIKIAAATDATPQQTLIGRVVLSVDAD